MRSLLSAATLLAMMELVHLGLSHTVTPPSLSIPEDNRAFGFTRSAFPPPASRLQQRYAQQQQQNNNIHHQHHKNQAISRTKHRARLPAKPTNVIDYSIVEDLSIVTMGFQRSHGQSSSDPVLITTTTTTTTTVSPDRNNKDDDELGYSNDQEHRVHHRHPHVVTTGSGIAKTAAVVFANQTGCAACGCCCCSAAEDLGFELSRLLKLASGI